MSDRAADLSARELQQVLLLLAAGLSDYAVAERLTLAHSTVHHHVGRIFEKLGVHNRTDAVVEGLRRGLIELPRPEPPQMP